MCADLHLRNRLLSPPVNNYPFLDPAFLTALEDSGSVGPGTGWEPCHITLKVTGGEAFMPLYVKTHSWGEYVFDWSWADVYHRNGLNYYPKLVTAVPFSPATGPRVRLTGNLSLESVAEELASRSIALAETTDASSWHLLFPDRTTAAAFARPDLLQRSGAQYHWLNRDYTSFDDFLSRFVARKRKTVRRERQRVVDQKLRVEMLPGEQISSELWDFFFALYQRTYIKRSGNGGYLTREFFARIGATLAPQVAMAVAYDANSPVACALFFSGDNTLYGRYWGCIREYDCLHFELCYYQGIEYAIRQGLHKFDAGAQGEHKILRGFEPVETLSLHWIRHPEFRAAIARFVRQEQADINAYIAHARTALPYRKARLDP